jgi:hypothetical protein
VALASKIVSDEFSRESILNREAMCGRFCSCVVQCEVHTSSSTWEGLTISSWVGKH